MTLVGRRVRLVRCADEATRLVPGLEGTVREVDGLGTLHVNWDNGSTLGLIPDEDEWEILDPEIIPSATAARILRARAADLEARILDLPPDEPLDDFGDLQGIVAFLSEIVAHLLDLHPEDPEDPT